ncbi:hypothetical protein TSUD_248270 [Trifolium subterraneum]|uniref:Rad21/Rec8-like protein N-terminal domain-containing protein n=1 Tax=Trifolium subterraneum TaxID=3900 RepID=A0A2Z6LP94_TRISU|nr:hypothetical protein TSUD_248270 [Trifolium subterraneum]
MAATMHAKINRKKLSKLNIIKICEEILNPAIPMALRLSGILMGGVVIVYERKVKMLYDDVSRLLVEINEAWKVKSGPDPTLLPKGKSQAKRSAITLPDKEQMTMEIEQSNATTTTWFQHNNYVSMTLDDVDEPNVGDRDPGDDHHQVEDQQPEHPSNQQHNDSINARKEPQRRGPAKRRRVKSTEMDCEQTVIAAPTYQSWLQDPSALISERGGMKKLQRRHYIMLSMKIDNLMEVPTGAIKDDLFSIVNKDIHYPTPVVDAWIKSTQPPHDSPSVTISSRHPPEPSPTSSPGVHNNDFPIHGSEDLDDRLDNIINDSREKHVTQIPDNGLRVPDGTPHASSGKSDGFPGGDKENSIPSTVSGHHGLSSHSDLERGRPTKRTRRLSSGNSSGGLYTVAENENLPDANFKLSRLSNIGPSPDQDLFVETAPTQTQGKANDPSDELTKSIHHQLKSHFESRGAPQYESLDALTTGMSRKKAALLFYQTCVLATRDILRVEQEVDVDV